MSIFNKFLCYGSLAVLIGGFLSLGEAPDPTKGQRSSQLQRQEHVRLQRIARSQARVLEQNGVKAVATTNPIMFVTQFPIASDFGTIGSTFSNHRADVALVGRGGDLYIRYGDGTLRNLTREAGFGSGDLIQGANAIAVRDPHVHWSGTKAVFSMVVGGQPQPSFDEFNFYWQLYEVTGLGAGETAQVTKVPHQPVNFNNLMPAYASDGQIIFVSDRTLTGERHLYPLMDEYESARTNTGLWKLDPLSGTVKLMQYSPSGSFDPFVDSFGRVVFTRWDHLMRDQQNFPGSFYEAFNYESEAASALPKQTNLEVFPEPREDSSGLNRFVINHFFPWQINEDGTQEETLNHLGRQELHKYFTRSFTNDPNLQDFEYSASGRTNPRESFNYLYLHEDPTHPGRYYSTDAPEFQTLGSGQIVRFDAPRSKNPDDVVIDFVTHYDTRQTNPSPNNSGHYRNTIVLRDGSLIATHTPTQGIAAAKPDGTSNYEFRLRKLVPSGAYQVAGPSLIEGAGMVRNIRFYSGNNTVNYNGAFWEMSAVEVVARRLPPKIGHGTAVPEANAYVSAGVNESSFKQYLHDRNLAVVVVRDVTARDDADKQQPFNLRVVNGGRQTPQNPTGIVYDIAHMQMFQGDQIRGLKQRNTGGGFFPFNPIPGRRVLAQAMHDPLAINTNIPNPTGPAGSVKIFADGSVAAFVPAARALSWQTTAQDGTPVVRERFWITLQPGEVRACGGCHGVNKVSQGGQPESTQTPQAFIELLRYWKQNSGAQ